MSSSPTPSDSAVIEATNSSLTDEVWYRVIKNFLFATAFLISVAGNSLVAYIIFTRIRMKTITNLFILNLAMGDLIYAFASPFDIAIQENGKRWIYLPFFCKILSPLQTIAMSSSLLTLTMLSLTRYKAIVHPLERQMREGTAKLTIVMIWILSFSTVLPLVVHKQVVDDRCYEAWENQEIRKAYTAFLFGLQYVIPLTIMTVAYGTIALELYKPAPSGNIVVQIERDKEAQKVVAMLVTVTVTFAICTLPTSVMWLWLDFGDAERSVSYFWDVLDILYVFDFINLGAHPIIYVYFSKKFRNEMKATFKKEAPPNTGRNSATTNSRSKYVLTTTEV